MDNVEFKSFDSLQLYQTMFDQMRAYTLERDKESADKIWFLEHHPVFTQGQAGKAEHLLNPMGIEVVQSDRGGQITYHGPGQLMIYTLLNLKRLQLGPRALVCALEKSVIGVLAHYQIKAHGLKDAPGVYLEDGSKIASIGLRIRKGFSYHGISFNHSLDLKPFSGINPCGFKNLKVARLIDLVPSSTRAQIEQLFKEQLLFHCQAKLEEPHYE